MEWRINAPDGTSKVLEARRGTATRIWQRVHGWVLEFVINIRKFLVESWNIGVAEPKKFIHCLKVGLALSTVSLFYYVRPLYEGVGGNAMWAIMTVVVVFEYTVGATLCKCINRAIATVIAGSLGFGIHWVASHCGHKYEPLVLGTSVFIFASAATFSRFIPAVKARFDYGAMIFILTFSFVSVSGYRVDKLIMLAHTRASTIAIGTSLCILISYVAEYFSNGEIPNIGDEDLAKKLQGYKCVLNSKATEESMVNFARWEPAHGHFYFGYPWKQYLKIGASARNCAYCIDNLSSCIDSDLQVPEFLKNQIKENCTSLSSSSAEVLKELATAIKTRRRSFQIDFLVEKMNCTAEDLHDAIKSLPYQIVLSPPTVEGSAKRNAEKTEKSNKASVLEVLPLGTLVTLLIETAARVQEIVLAVDNLAKMAKFKTKKQKKSKENPSCESANEHSLDQESMKTFEKV
ncbi:hypothetical protein Cgig2_031043 [Carnegiea gigantea]|uniref:Aluminum-activated malate transporter 10 n=1 Tax=Carnegiea gigantea TaxID=171969 RepID=A0A9Q1QGG2_9CARY|nr:hypothetical protein Cgig2_031043 [Carnegiea gigantea]